ncbi:MAG: hypothetical protein AAFX41_16880 [Bacteroidota bacterium]
MALLKGWLRLGALLFFPFAFVADNIDGHPHGTTVRGFRELWEEIDKL